MVNPYLVEVGEPKKSSELGFALSRKSNRGWPINDSFDFWGISDNALTSLYSQGT